MPESPLVAALMALAVVTSVGCGRRRLGPPEGGAPDVGGAGTEVLDAAAGAGASDAPAGEVGSDAAGEAGVDAPEPSPAVVAEAFNRMRDEIERARFVECFGAGPGPLATWRFAFESAQDYDLRAGLVAIDPALFDKCLETARTASCAGVASGAIEAACDHVLAGQVPNGGFCLNDQDCAGPAPRACKHERAKCGAHCVPGPSVGIGMDGAPCKGDGCAPGFSCVYPGPRTLTGVCRARAGGAPCDGKWACPFPFTCVFDDAGKGTCGTGSRAGEPCELYGFDAFNGPYDGCAISLGCFPDAQGVFRCGEGVETGAQCGSLPPPKPDQNSGFIPCRTDLCDPDSSPPRCVPYKKEGESCTVYYQCADDLECWKGTCRRAATAGLTAGEVCKGDFSNYCAQGAFCDYDPDDLSAEPHGICRAWFADGKACSNDGQCGPQSGCVAGTCSPCKP